MPADPRDAPETPRRRFLSTLVLVPAAAAAACAAPKAAAPPAAAKPGTPPPAAPPEDPYAPLRAVPLALDAEPAFVFRALPARDRE